MITAAVTAPAVPSNLVALGLTILAVLPGLWAAYSASRTRKALRERVLAETGRHEGDVGVGFAKEAFEGLRVEVEALRQERREWEIERSKWSVEREIWATERLALMSRIEALNFQILKLTQAVDNHTIK